MQVNIKSAVTVTSPVGRAWTEERMSGREKAARPSRTSSTRCFHHSDSDKQTSRSNQIRSKSYGGALYLWFKDSTNTLYSPCSIELFLIIQTSGCVCLDIPVNHCPFIVCPSFRLFSKSTFIPTNTMVVERSAFANSSFRIASFINTCLPNQPSTIAAAVSIGTSRA